MEANSPKVALLVGPFGTGKTVSENMYHDKKAMVTKYGMSKHVGLISHNSDDDGKSLSSLTRLLIEEGVKELLEREPYANAKTILTTHSREIHALSCCHIGA